MLNFTSNNNNILSARTNDVSYAVANDIVQIDNEPDFESCRDGRAIWLANNISSSDSDIDKLYSTVPLHENDRIFIVKKDGTIADWRIPKDKLTSSNFSVIPEMTSDTEPSGKVTGKNIFKSNPDWTENQNTISIYEFEEPCSIDSIYFKTISKSRYDSKSDYSFNISVSDDGINFIIIAYDFSLTNENYTPIPFPKKAKFIKISVNKMRSSLQVQFLATSLETKGTSSVVDTSPVTQGEKPEKVFKFMDTCSINGAVFQEKTNYTEYGTHGDKLYIAQGLQDLVMPSRVLTPRVDFKAVGNELIELSTQVYKKIVT